MLGFDVTDQQGNPETLTYSPAVLFCKAQFNIGDSWSNTSTKTHSGGSSYSVKWDFTAVGLEDVTVSAGTFKDTIKIKIVTTDNKTEETAYYWFAKGVGVVKEDWMGSPGELQYASVGGTSYGSSKNNATVRANTENYTITSDGYWLRLEAWDAFKTISSGSVSGPNVSSTSLTKDTDNNNWKVHASLGQTRPTVGDTYTFNLSYTDGTSEALTASVTAVNDNFATIVSPSDGSTVTTTSPTFSWQAATNSSGYLVEVTDTSGNRLWKTKLSSSTTSVAFNSDGTATTSLQSGQSYNWAVHSYDTESNQAGYWATFTVQKSLAETWVQRVYGGAEEYNIQTIVTGENLSSVSISGPNTVQEVYESERMSSTSIMKRAQLSGRPSIGDTYTITVTFTDGTTESKTWSVNGINDTFATLTSPTNNAAVNTLTPTFTWEAASNASFYGVDVRDNSTGEIIWSKSDIQTTSTSITYNSDNTGSALQSGKTYSVHMHSTDSNINQATYIVDFTTAANAAKAPALNKPSGVFLQAYDTVKHKLAAFALAVWGKIRG